MIWNQDLSPFLQPKQIPGTTTKLPYVILGDQGYPLKDYLMRPYGTDNAAFCREIAAYNYRHSRARRTVECAFGILVSKWRCLKTQLQVLPEHVDKLVLTACLLHSLIIDKDGNGKAHSFISIQPLGRFSRNQSPVRRPIWLWHTASWASS